MQVARYIGEIILYRTRTLNDIWNLLVFSIWSASLRFWLGRRATTNVIYKQVYFTAFEALPIISWTALLLGLIIVTQAFNILPRLGGEERIGEVLVWTVVREVGPLFASIIVTARSGTAIAAELGTMRMSRQLEALDAMGIDPMHYLVMPRVIGAAISLVILTFYIEAVTILGGFLLAGLGKSISFSTYMSSFFEEIGFLDIGVSLLKSALFGVIIGAVCCYHGLMVSGSITRIPQETTRAVIGSLWVIFVADGIITFIFFM